MTIRRQIAQFGLIFAVTVFPSFSPSLVAQDVNALKKEVDELRDQNLLLQKQLQQQQEMIDQLSRKFSGLQKTNELQEKDVSDLKAAAENAPAPPEKSRGFSLNNVVISGEGAVGFFETGKNGQFPNAAFRVDEARLFVDAMLWDDVFFYGQVDLMTREEQDAGLYLGELYLQWENVLKYWNLDQLLNVRAGQFYTPFGEEYQRRFAIDNVLISHSLSDLWALSPGLELYGGWKHLTYVAAVQNGGDSTLNDGTADKSIAARIGYDPSSWLHFSVSGMRTGKLSVSQDVLSAMWFGDGFFKSIGSPATSLFQVNLAEFDAQTQWKNWNGGYVRAAGGYAGYDDNDPAGDNHRDIYYYYVEALQHLTRKVYAATRWSQIRVPNGYSIVGDTDTYGLPTSDLWRLSLGLGYQFNDHLVLKAEYMFEQGRLSTGGTRNLENMVAAEAAFKF
ncbi:MAG TPA: outer membrane beta-barrel protein [Verrucomicrobiae bacterium]|nr:outer membrane beta-barrel protein [Verrucomicrobiae bacterium]